VLKNRKERYVPKEYLRNQKTVKCNITTVARVSVLTELPVWDAVNCVQKECPIN